MRIAVDGSPAPATPPSRTRPTDVDLVTPRQAAQAGPPRPGTPQGFGSAVLVEAQSPSPAPSDRRARPGNELSTFWLEAGASPHPCCSFNCST